MVAAVCAKRYGGGTSVKGTMLSEGQSCCGVIKVVMVGSSRPFLIAVNVVGRKVGVVEV
jgi:hypothetical protein